MATHGHARADERSLGLHRAALANLRRRPELKAKVQGLLARWLEEEGHKCSRPWLEEWREMLASWPLDRVEQLILDVQQGQPLRQCSPLAPALTPQERWAVLRAVNERLAREEAGAGK